MKTVDRKIDDLIPAEYNPRQMTEKQSEDLRASLKRFGVVEPILINTHKDRKNIVIGGHQRLRVWKGLGYDTIPCVEIKVNRDKERELNIRLNQNVGEWDWVALGKNFGLDELDNWGFDEVDLDFNFGEEETDADAEPQIDQAEELNKKWKVKDGDLWQVGDHRLLCGDATKAEDVGRLMDGATPLLMVTDPPYGVKYDADWRNHALRANGTAFGGRAVGKVDNDDRADWSPAWKLFSGDVAYVWHPPGATQGVFLSSLEVVNLEIRMTCIWAKNQFPIGRGHYHVKHEPCFYAVRKDKTAHWAADRKQTTLWEIDKPRKSETGHSTQKPIECMARPIRNHDAAEVYDPFIGSGTTMVAAQNLGRKCYGMEISPNYCAVILQRMRDAFPEIKIEKKQSNRNIR